MKLSEYFESTKGIGVLATADKDGVVDVAIYARPHFIDEETVVFIMADRLSHKNLESNPHAAYIFIESGEGYSGKRLYLTKINEEKDSPLIEKISRKKYPTEKYGTETKYLVYFKIDKVRSLVGD